MTISYETIKIYENNIVSKSEAARVFGTVGQRRNFKANGKFTGGTGSAFKKRLEGMFEKVDTSISGCVDFGEAKPIEEISIKELRGGNKEVPYRPFLEALVLLSLQKNIFKKHEATMGTWLYNFGLVNELFYHIKTYSTADHAVKQYQKKLVDKKIIKDSSRVLELNFFKEQFFEQQEKLKGVLTNLKKHGMIDFYQVPKAKLLLSEEEEKLSFKEGATSSVVTLETSYVAKMNEIQLRLRDIYGIEREDLNPYSKKEKTKEKKEALRNYGVEFNKYLQGESELFLDDPLPYPITNFWYNHAIIVQTTKKEVAEYLYSRRPKFYPDYVKDYDDFLRNMQNSYTEEINKRMVLNIDKKSDRAVKRLQEQSKLLSSASATKGFKKVHTQSKKEKTQTELDKLIYSWDITFREQAKRMVADFKPDFILRLLK